MFAVFFFFDGPQQKKNSHRCVNSVTSRLAPLDRQPSGRPWRPSETDGVGGLRPVDLRRRRRWQAAVVRMGKRPLSFAGQGQRTCVVTGPDEHPPSSNRATRMADYRASSSSASYLTRAGSCKGSTFPLSNVALHGNALSAPVDLITRLKISDC